MTMNRVQLHARAREVRDGTAAFEAAVAPACALGGASVLHDVRAERAQARVVRAHENSAFHDAATRTRELWPTTLTAQVCVARPRVHAELVGVAVDGLVLGAVIDLGQTRSTGTSRHRRGVTLQCLRPDRFKSDLDGRRYRLRIPVR